MAIAEPRGRADRTASIRSGLVEVAVRGLLVGLGVGVLLRSSDIGVASLTVIGVLALGAALTSWSR